MDRNMKLFLQRGFSLLEVLIAIVIFAIGMLALATLQGSLTRSSADANLRTTAANIAERTIESLRGFGRIDSDPNIDLSARIVAYNDIVDIDPEDPNSTPVNPYTWQETAVTDGVILFTRSIEVTDYVYDLATDTFIAYQLPDESLPNGRVYSDFKEVEVTVAWGVDSGYQIADASTISSEDLGSGEIVVSAFVSSASTQGSARVSTQKDENDFEPFVNYTPGQNLDIVSLTLATGRFKESLTPQPDVTRSNELVETRFDVITYSQSNADALFLRREEFVAVTCKCLLKAAPTDGSFGGRRPMLWAGDEYIEPEFVAKAYGESANNQQSTFCDTCCQDHHDGGSGANDPDNDLGAILFNPYRASADYLNSGDHIHYNKDHRGNLSPASAGQTYVEACRLVRKDGFFRVAQDFRMEGLNVFPYDYLDEPTEVVAYSSWLTGAVKKFTKDVIDNGYDSTATYDFIAPDLGEPARTDYGNSPASGDLRTSYTHLPTIFGKEYQQLRSRGIYIDYLTADLRAMIRCLAVPNDVSYCNGQGFGDVILDKTGSGNLLEIIPFFEVQMTFLNRWNTAPIDDPVTVSNDAIVTGNDYSRGCAFWTTDCKDKAVKDTKKTIGITLATATGHNGVLGLTGTEPIDLNYAFELMNNDLQVFISDDYVDDGIGTTVTFKITSGVDGVDAQQVDIEASNAACTRTNIGFYCVVPINSTSATVTLTNYTLPTDKKISACQYDKSVPSAIDTSDPNRPFTIFSLNNAVDTVTYQISIESGACGG